MDELNEKFENEFIKELFPEWYKELEKAVKEEYKKIKSERNS